MGLFNRTKQLFKIDASTDEDQTGPVYAIVPKATGSYDFRAFVDLTMVGGSGTPSVTLHVETSHDGEGWIPIITPVALTEPGELHELVEVWAVGPMLRARTVLEGSVKPHHTVTVELAATARFSFIFKTKGSSGASEPVDLGELERGVEP